MGEPTSAPTAARAAPPAPAAGGIPLRARAAGVLRACRPKQWLKNLLVFAAPGAAGALTDPDALARSLLAFALFCVAAAGTYLLNDARDVEADRRHERKRHRPVAAGTVPVPLAVGLGCVLVVAAPLAAVPTGNSPLLAVLVGYLVLTAGYTLWLKHVPVCDIVAVAGCHVLRALAGGVAIGVPITSWFLIVVSLGALLVVTGKREAELRNPDSGGSRATLTQYSVGYLTQVRTMASGAMIVTYCLWALEHHEGAALGFHAASIVPFIMFVLRHHLLVDRGVGEEPEEIALHDRPTQLYLVALVGLVGLGIHFG
ncbi:decaprenyl-phosphate phosphoribosyltransferase [Spinactinospora alkalitolerans]|uniref:Decaprenyl-phosphate phosphoribosyltransferase n=1 Tax=Spinactinospora alkalitolerans TaxID=687207 RepID=A0A852U208_9ACTN|nr:decaprenyl-phosphate phosphoribosyltransferase [Spinactinospora alkalitolerans]NYE49575.1 decaprenyl-phosphate phosphoribosyltransferase [Spinactinospora alkalitolerans]